MNSYKVNSYKVNSYKQQDVFSKVITCYKTYVCYAGLIKGENIERR